MVKNTQQQNKLCRRCGRKLTSEASKSLGMGETCFKKWSAEHRHKKLFNFSSLQTSKDSV